MRSQRVYGRLLRLGAAIGALAFVGACGGGGGTNSTPAPIAAPTPTPTPQPTPTPSPTPTPAAVFDTEEYRFSDGPAYHNAIAGWHVGATGKGVTIGIVDTGIDLQNREFAGRISGKSADVAGQRSVDDTEGHGTMAALVAAAARDNSGIVGIAWQATILALRADDPGSCESSDGCSFYDDDIARGVDAAVAGGARVINLSLGGSAPTAAMRQAVTRAGNAGVLVVVAAGNDADDPPPNTDPNQPDAFATGLRQAGSGNVIIAGSVTTDDELSLFSNRAGTEANWYLAALGDRVCCIYENGDLKTFTDDAGDTYVYVASGTSFSAPQIAGAAALLFQAFPNLTGQQVADLLLRSARDVGSPGTDTVFGRGVLDIAKAFAAQGTTSLAGSSTPLALADTSLVTSGAMGDAGQGPALSAIVLDSYQRAYRVNLGATARSAQVPSRLASTLTAPMRQVSDARGPVALAYSVDASHRAASLPWSGQLRLGADDASAAQVLAARIVARVSPGTSVAFGYAQGADGLIAQVQGSDAPAFLIARNPGADLGFAQSGELAFAVRHALGRWGLTVAGSRGDVMTGAPVRDAGTLFGYRDHDGYARLGLSLDRQWDGIDTGLGMSWLDEDRTVLGARLHEAFGARGADSLFLDLRGGWRFAPGWRAGAAWRQGYTRARTSGLVAQGSRFTSSGWAFDLSRAAVFQPGDSLALRVSQPLRVSSGGLNLDLPVAWSYDTLSATSGLQRLALTPRGREIAGELAWRGSLWGGSASANLFWRKDPGHFAGRPDDTGVAVGWRTGF